MNKLYDLVEAFIDKISAQSDKFGLLFDPDEDIKRHLYCAEKVCRLEITLEDAFVFLRLFRFICKYAYDNPGCIIDSLDYKDHVIVVDIMTPEALVKIFYE